VQEPAESKFIALTHSLTLSFCFQIWTQRLRGIEIHGNSRFKILGWNFHG